MSYLNETKYIDQVISEAEKKVCEVYGVLSKDIREKTRRIKCVQARFAVYYLLFNVYGMSSTDIARHFKVDRGSVTSGIVRAEMMKMGDEMKITSK